MLWGDLLDPGLTAPLNVLFSNYLWHVFGSDLGGPRMLVIANKGTIWVSRERRLSCSRQAEEERSVTILANVRRAVHRERALLWEHKVHNRENALLIHTTVVCTLEAQFEIPYRAMSPMSNTILFQARCKTSPWDLSYAFLRLFSWRASCQASTTRTHWRALLL